jgi:hypothetical protein
MTFILYRLEMCATALLLGLVQIGQKLQMINKNNCEFIARPVVYYLTYKSIRQRSNLMAAPYHEQQSENRLHQNGRSTRQAW